MTVTTGKVTTTTTERPPVRKKGPSASRILAAAGATATGFVLVGAMGTSAGKGLAADIVTEQAMRAGTIGAMVNLGGGMTLRGRCADG